MMLDQTQIPAECNPDLSVMMDFLGCTLGEVHRWIDRIPKVIPKRTFVEQEMQPFSLLFVFYCL